MSNSHTEVMTVNKAICKEIWVNQPVSFVADQFLMFICLFVCLFVCLSVMCVTATLPDKSAIMEETDQELSR